MNTNQTLKYTLWAGLFAGLLIPFIVAGNQFFPYITGKGFVFRIGVEVLFVLWVALALRDRTYAPRFSWILGTLGVFIVFLGVADFFAVNAYKAFWSNFERMEGYITLLHLFLYFIIASTVFNTQKLWTIFFNTSVGASVVMCLYGFLQLHGDITINQGGVRLDGTLGNAIYLAIYMMFNMFLAGYLCARARYLPVVRYFIYVPIILMQGIILYYTATRGVILGLVGGAFVTAFLIALLERTDKKLRMGAIGACVVILLAVGAFVLARNSEFVRTSPTLSRFATLSLNDIKTQGRYFIWPMALEGFKERPILGWGQEGFNYVFNKHYVGPMYTQETWFDRTHNMYLDWLISGGILGLLAYLTLIGFLVYSIWKTQFTVKEKALLFGLVGAYLFQGLFAFDNLISYIYLFSILAFVHADTVRDREPIRWFDRLTQNQNIGMYVVLPIVGLVFVSVLYVANVKPILANRQLIRAISAPPSVQAVEEFKKVFTYNTFANTEATEQLYVNLARFQAEGVDPQARAAFEAEAEKELRAQVDRTPTDTRHLLFLSGFLNRVGKFEEAIPYLERARKTSPQKQAVLFELGASLINLKRYPEALAVFKEAYEVAPDFVESQVFYGLAALYVGNEKLSTQILSSLDQNTLLFDERILSAYAQLARWNKVIEILKKRIEKDPKNVQQYFSLAAAYIKSGDRSSAIQQLLKGAQVEPRTSSQVQQIISDIQAGKI